MVGSEVFLMKLKHQCHLSQLVERAYNTQSWKEIRLLPEFLFIPIDKWTLILKNYGKWGFSYESKASISFIPMSRMSLWYLIMKRKEIIMWIHLYPIDRWTQILKMVEREAFLMKPKHRYHLS